MLRPPIIKQLELGAGCMLLSSRFQSSAKSAAAAAVKTFDTSNKRTQRERAILKLSELPVQDAEGSDRVRDEIAYRIFDRVCDVKRKFNTVLDLGCGRSSYLAKHFQSDMLNHLVQYDTTRKVVDRAYSEMLKQAANGANTAVESGQISGSASGTDSAKEEKPIGNVREIILPSEFDRCIVHPELRTANGVRSTYVHFDREEQLPFADSSFDLVVSCLHLQWVNDLTKCFAEVRRVLKPDGAFIAATVSRDTLFELRVALQLAEMEREGGFGVHVSPFIEPSDVAGLLHRTDFRLITVDIDELQVVYPDAFALLADLRHAAEQHAATLRKPSLHRHTLIAAAALYQSMFGAELPPDESQEVNQLGQTEQGQERKSAADPLADVDANAAGGLFSKGVQATYNITYLIGWKADKSQAKPAARGSGEVSLKDISRFATAQKPSQTPKS